MNFDTIEAEIKAQAKDDPRSGIDEYSGNENLSYVRASTTHQEQDGILWIQLKSTACWDNTSPWDDYSGYIKEESLYNWVGLASNLSTIESIEQLTQWAKYAYTYKNQLVKSDASYTCSHSGIQVKHVSSGHILLEEAAKATTQWVEEKRNVLPKFFFSKPQTVMIDR